MSSHTTLRPIDTARLRFASLAFILLFVAVALVLRFVGLEHTPPGFYIDEAAIAAQVMCVAQTGTDWSGNHLPLQSAVLGGGYASFPMLYLGAAWETVFGSSIGSLRAFVALHGVATVAGIGVLGRLIGGARLGLVAALICLTLPWAFLSARVFWDPPLAPAYVIWGLVFFWLAVAGFKPAAAGTAGQWRRLGLAGVAGIFFALACYAYSPVRVQVAMVLAALFVLSFIKQRLPAFLVSAAVATILAAPLISATLSGEIQGRFNMLSVFNPDHLASVGLSGWSGGLRLFLENMVGHFSWGYIAETGDHNLRHSTQWQGQWNWLEIVALALLPVALQPRLHHRPEDPVAPNSAQGTGVGLRWLPFAVFAFVAGIVPAALTWEGNPHALRSIGAYPFLALAAGMVWTDFFDRFRTGHILFAGLLVSNFALFAGDMFTTFPERARDRFDTDVVIGMAESDARSFDSLKQAFPKYKDLAIRYHALRRGLVSCPR